VTFAVELVRGEQTIRVDAGPEQTVLNAAEAADESLPFGCRTGACGTCTGRVLAGEVAHRRPPRALKQRHLDAGYALLCIAEPRSDCRITVGKDVVAELVDNPWK
jgi:ferredoxin